MNVLVPATCSIPAQAAAKAALMRRIEAAARTNEDRQDAPRERAAHARPAPVQVAQPASTLAAHILGARDGYANASGYGAYAKANDLLSLDSRTVDMTVS